MPQRGATSIDRVVNDARASFARQCLVHGVDHNEGHVAAFNNAIVEIVVLLDAARHRSSSSPTPTAIQESNTNADRNDHRDENR